MELVYPNKKSAERMRSLIAEASRANPPLEIGSSKGCVFIGDNFPVMAQLLPLWGGKVDLVYIDPPFNTSGTFVYDSAHVATVSRSLGATVAYDDNLSTEEYLEFMRERLFLIHELLSPCGTLYFHIDTKMGHYIKVLLDEVFGTENFLNDVSRLKSNPKNFSRRAFGNEKDSILVYSKSPGKNIFNDIREPLSEAEVADRFTKVDSDGRRYTTVPCHAPGETRNGPTGGPWKGVLPPKGRHWRSSPAELDKLDAEGMIEWSANNVPRIKRYADKSQGKKIQDIWLEYKDPQYPLYPTQKNPAMMDLIVRQSSVEGSVVMDCFCGSGAFLKAGLARSRFVIGVEKSPVAASVMRESPILAELEFLDLAKWNEGKVWPKQLKA